VGSECTHTRLVVRILGVQSLNITVHHEDHNGDEEDDDENDDGEAGQNWVTDNPTPPIFMVDELVEGGKARRRSGSLKCGARCGWVCASST